MLVWLIGSGEIHCGGVAARGGACTYCTSTVLDLRARTTRIACARIGARGAAAPDPVCSAHSRTQLNCGWSLA